MKNDRLMLLGLGVLAAYVVWRVQAAQGGPVVWVNPMAALLPENPSTVRPGGGAGLPDLGVMIGNLFSSVGDALKGPGNTSPYRNLDSAPGTNANPVGAPSEITGTQMPAPPSFVPESGYLPTLADPNFIAFNFLASMPPDLAWGIAPNVAGYTV